MANTNFIDSSTVIVADWCNDVNDTVYEILGDGTNPPSTAAQARTNLDVPANDGTGASGTWGINITGNAVTATTATNATSASTATTAVTVSGSLASGVTATTQTAGDNSTKVATTQYVTTAVNNAVSLGTYTITTSGTQINITSGIPSNVKRIEIGFIGVSTSAVGSSPLLLQIGSTTIQTSSYTAYAGSFNNANQTATSSSTSGFVLTQALGNTSVIHGIVTLILINSSTNTWVCSFSFGGLDGSGGNIVRNGGGSVSLSGALDRIRLTTVNGTDVFDAGAINTIYG